MFIRDGKSALVALNMAEPRLLAGEDRLWIIAREHVAYFKDDKLQTTPVAKGLGEFSRPFMQDGKLAVLTGDQSRMQLMVFEAGEWRTQKAFKLDTPDVLDVQAKDVQVVVTADGVQLFCRPGGSGKIYRRTGLPETDKPDPDAWETVVKTNSAWTAVDIDGELAVFYHANIEGLCAAGLKKSDDNWVVFFRYPVGWDMDLGVAPTGEGDGFVLMRQVLADSTKIIGVSGNLPVWKVEQKGDIHLTEEFKRDSKIARIITYLPIPIMVLILTIMMSKCRVNSYGRGDNVVHFASIGRRALAATADLVLLAPPLR